MSQNSDLRSCPTDRLTNLPGSLIDNILKRLPLYEAVRTSILSRDWRHKWVTIPHLDFDRGVLLSLERTYDFMHLIDQILLLHKGDVTMFSIEHVPIKNDLAISRWLFFLSDRRVEDLSLSYFSAKKEHDGLPVLPACLYAFDSLTRLCIRYATFKLPSTFTGFSKIVSLKLMDVSIQARDLTMLLSKCPKLEDLVLGNCGANVHFEINAPNLKRFTIWGRFCSIYFKSMYLVEITICYHANSGNPDPSEFRDSIPANLLQVLCNLPHVKHMTLNSTVIEYMANGGVPVRLPKKLNLISLTLYHIELGRKKDVDCILCLMRSSPNLCTLYMDLPGGLFFNDENHEVDILQHLKALQECNLTLSCLKHVKIEYCSGFEYEIEFVKLLLLHAPELEKLEVKTAYCNKTKKRKVHKTLKELARLCRASSQPVLLF